MAMKDKITRKLIDITVSRAIKDIREDPRRGIHGLIDKLREQAGDKLRPEVLETARAMLENPDSPYFKLTARTVRQTEQSALEGFGINMGYNALSAGGGTIRELEKKYSYNIPWIVGLSYGQGAALGSDRLCSVIGEGKRLGIYSYALIHTCGDVCAALPAISKNDDCAFLLFVSGEALSDAAVSRLARCHNLMFAVLTETPGCAAACGRLRDSRALYSVYGHYGDDNIDSILSGEWMKTAAGFEPLLSMLAPRGDADDYMREKVTEYVRERRAQPEFVTVPVEIPSDVLYVDSAVSEGDCSVMFDASGQLYGYTRRYAGAEFNLSKNQLRDILKTAFPK